MCGYELAKGNWKSALIQASITIRLANFQTEIQVLQLLVSFFFFLLYNSEYTILTDKWLYGIYVTDSHVSIVKNKSSDYFDFYQWKVEEKKKKKKTCFE